jgi:DNA-binding transcriptional regulator YbjK
MTAGRRRPGAAGAARIAAREAPAQGRTTGRKQEILDVARTLLIAEGYSNFSLRRIASEAGVSLRTVQHHFRSKDDLMKAVLWNTVSGYDESPQGERGTSRNVARTTFVRNLQSMLADTHHEETAGFFYQLWSYAYYRREGADVCNAVYEEHVRRIAGMMKPLNPKMSATRRNRRAVIVAALIDGMMVVNGYGRRPLADVAGTEKEVIDTALRLAMED